MAGGRWQVSHVGELGHAKPHANASKKKKKKVRGLISPSGSRGFRDSKFLRLCDSAMRV